MTNPIIKYYENGNKKLEQYRSNGKCHRDPLEGPSFISYYENGQKKREQYLVNGKWHRDSSEGPSFIWYDENGHKKVEKYVVNGDHHNPYGPAIVDYDYGRILWFFNDIEYTNEVKEYLDKNNLIWQNMDQTDFAIMWCCIL